MSGDELAARRLAKRIRVEAAQAREPMTTERIGREMAETYRLAQVAVAIGEPEERIAALLEALEVWTLAYIDAVRRDLAGGPGVH